MRDDIWGAEPYRVKLPLVTTKPGRKIWLELTADRSTSDPGLGFASYPRPSLECGDDGSLTSPED